MHGQLSLVQHEHSEMDMIFENIWYVLLENAEGLSIAVLQGLPGQPGIILGFSIKQR